MGRAHTWYARLDRLQENTAAADIQLNTVDLDEIEAGAATVAIQGARYLEHLERATNLYYLGP